MKFPLIVAMGVATQLVFFGVPFFAVAGTFDWLRAWILLGVIALGSVLSMVLVFRRDEGLLRERMKPLIQKGQPRSDQVLVVLLITVLVAWVAFIPLDVFRLHLLPRPPFAVSAAGLIFFVAGWTIVSLTMRENSFAAPVVKNQRDRGQKVIDTGVYSVVRHPMYAGTGVFMIGMSLWLESLASLAGVAAIMVILMIRIAVEEQFLVQHLPGYAGYCEKVRCRLLPGIW